MANRFFTGFGTGTSDIINSVTLNPHPTTWSVAGAFYRMGTGGATTVGSGFVGTATISGGAVTGVTITNGGANYGGLAMIVNFYGGGGSGAIGRTAQTSGAITSVTIDSGGSGFTSPPSIVVGQGLGRICGFGGTSGATGERMFLYFNPTGVKTAGDPASTFGGVSRVGFLRLGINWTTSSDYYIRDGFEAYKWYNYVITYDASSNTNVPRFWLNGVEQTVYQVGAANVAPYITSPSMVTVGNRSSFSTSNRGFAGALAEQAAWNRVLTPEEAIAVSNGFGAINFQRGLVSYIPGLGNATDLIATGTSSTGIVATTEHPRVISAL